MFNSYIFYVTTSRYPVEEMKKPLLLNSGDRRIMKIHFALTLEEHIYFARTPAEEHIHLRTYARGGACSFHRSG